VRFDDVLRELTAGLRADLPGPAAQGLMAPRPRRNWPPGMTPDRVRSAAGLLLLFPVGDEPHVLLTVRAHTLDRHGGQVSLPGGVIEAGETAEQAALREAHEEVGLSPVGVRRLGSLSPIDITVSGFRLHPVVAALAHRPDVEAADGEVARIIEPSVPHLMDRDHTAWRTLPRDTGTLEFPVFVAEGEEIWGATAMVLAELLAILGWQGPAPRRS
jgi:8-oxo-dGTP pyrophosphatase MutT (NUDIX family)